ncbi:Uncharacterised protein [Vibrio cholerae]|nr:Uncharacterised protein [Vibrio cholerae]
MALPLAQIGVPKGPLSARIAQVAAQRCSILPSLLPWQG